MGWQAQPSSRPPQYRGAHPNTEGADPDIGVGALAFTAAQAGASRGAARLVYRCQAYLFFPMLAGEAIGLHVASIRALNSQAWRHRCWEAALLAAHVAGYLTAVLLVLSPVKGVVFIVVQQGVFGLYLGCSFAPNHKGMPILDAGDLNPEVAAESPEKLDGLRVALPQGEVVRFLRIGFVHVPSATNLPDSAQRSAVLTGEAGRALDPRTSTAAVPARRAVLRPVWASAARSMPCGDPAPCGPYRRTNGYRRDRGCHLAIVAR